MTCEDMLPENLDVLPINYNFELVSKYLQSLAT